jgi:hypothetical protein
LFRKDFKDFTGSVHHFLGVAFVGAFDG